MIRPTHDKAAIVDTTVHWIDLNRTKPPGGAKVLLIDRRLGVATQGTWGPMTTFTHWAPLPTFAPEGDEVEDAPAQAKAGQTLPPQLQDALERVRVLCVFAGEVPKVIALDVISAAHDELGSRTARLRAHRCLQALEHKGYLRIVDGTVVLQEAEHEA